MFDKYDLSTKMLHEALENLKLALDNYEKNYQGKTYKYSFGDDIKISMNITNRYLNHLLGFEGEYINTWLSFISRHPFRSYGWLRDFSLSEEFIAYYVFARKQDPYFNFAKINYKSFNFKDFDLKNDTVFMFQDGSTSRKLVNIGTVLDDRITAIRVRNDGQLHYYAPVSFYVYDNVFANVADIKNITFPNRARIKNSKISDLRNNYTDENKEDTLNKIKKLIK